MAWELCWHGKAIEGPIQIILLEGIRLSSHTPVNSPCSPSIYDGRILKSSSVLSTCISLLWPISNYLDLSQFTLTYLKLPWPISNYLDISHYLDLSHFTLTLLGLPFSVSKYLDLSQFTSTYFSLSRPISVYLDLSQLTLTYPCLEKYYNCGSYWVHTLPSIYYFTF